MSDPSFFGPEDIRAVLPHRPPFLFVDRVVRLTPHQVIVAERVLRAEEPQFAGHFPGRPLMPGVLLTEALAQASGLLLALSQRLDPAQPPARPPMFHLAASSIKYPNPAKPGDVLSLRAELDRDLGGLHRFNVEATVEGRSVASGSLTLAFVGDQA